MSTKFQITQIGWGLIQHGARIARELRPCWAKNQPTRYLAIGLLMMLFMGCERVPQITHSARCMKCVDALYTAITAKDVARLDQCDTELKALRDDQQLSLASDRYLQEIVTTARNGNWEQSAQRIHRFIREQRAASVSPK